MINLLSGLKKAEGTDIVNRSFFNFNWDILDTFITTIAVKVSDIRGTGANSFKTSSACIASNNNSCAEGGSTYSTGVSSHSEGQNTTASGAYSHAEGVGSVAAGDTGHAEGTACESIGNISHAQGLYTKALHEGSHICGKLGETTENYGWFLGNGTSIDAKSLAAKILSNGNAYCDGAWLGGGADYAEYFEWYDGNPEGEDRVGLFVSLNGDKLTLAKEDDYVLGILSATPSIVGNSAEMRWKDKYICDKWGRLQYHEVNVQAMLVEGKEIVPEHKEIQPIINPDWDNIQEYIPRRDRVEWDAVGMLGRLRVRDDGTCQVNCYCKPGIDGVATTSETGYRVIKRITENVVEIIFK